MKNLRLDLGFGPIIPVSQIIGLYEMIRQDCFLRIENIFKNESLLSIILKKEDETYKEKYEIWEESQKKGRISNPPVSNALIILN